MEEQGVGPNLKRVRKQAGLSLSKTAEQTGVSKAMLGQIERGESSPTLATLWKICKGLRLPISAMIGATGDMSASSPVTQTSPHQIEGGPLFKTIFPFDPQTGCEVFLHELSPHWEHLSEAHNMGVVEDVFVIDGAVEILVDADWVRIERGQALRFNADQTHGYRNPLNTLSTFHNTIHYPVQIEGE